MARELENGFWLLIGLSGGLSLLGWYHTRLNLKLKRLVQLLKPDTLNWSLSSTSRLMRAIAAYGEEHQTLMAELDTWKHIIQVAPIGFLEVDQDNQLIWCNQQARETLCIQSAQLSQPRLLLELVRSYELDQLIEQTRTDAKPCQQEWTFHPVFSDPSILSQQSSQSLRGYGIPLPEEHVGVFLENRQESVSLTQQRDRWISDVAHELKTPLTSIRLVAETLQTRLEPPLRDWVDRLLRETIRLSNLVQDLLDLSQLQARSGSQLNLRTVDLPKLIHFAWSGLEPLAKQKQLELDYAGSDTLLLEIDESRMHRALLNLFDNSIKYSPEQTAIQVKVKLLPDSNQPQQVCLEVIDRGPGFPESALPLVFERFYRVDPSRTRNTISSNNQVSPASGSQARQGYSGGTLPPLKSIALSSGSGLGLAIVRQIIEAHGGSVKASNHPQTHGAWLQVLLPYKRQNS